ncbi:MAG: type II toxin-antitoxin system prevent-host-death family antitoxin [Verrucomicrobia bacterium]|nr:type II toxin-antitoxin system prevent-host-death family antitoxin [Verrucomicrobiota bacterium]
MTATLEQVQGDLQKLLNAVQQGEEIVITDAGRAVAKLTAVAQKPSSSDRRAWLARLAQLRERTATLKGWPTSDQILEDLRAERG